MFETETVGLCLVQKLKWGGHGPRTQPPHPPSVYAPAIIEIVLIEDASDAYLFRNKYLK